MREYKIEDKMPYGKCAGEALSDIYQFQPSYIEYLINYDPTFYIDMTIFKSLPKPTPFIPKTELPFIGEKKISLLTQNDAKSNAVKRAKAYLKSGKTIPETDFHFSASTYKSLNEKRQGVFVAPPYPNIWDTDNLSFF